MASVLNNVDVLFGQIDVTKPGAAPNAVYSCVGPVLITMNPFCELPLYTAEWQKANRSSSMNEVTRLALHYYRTAQESYSRLVEVEHQSVVICGESGAGKTVTNRKMIEYLCKTTKSAKKGTGADPQQFTKSNVLLEAFINAKTTRNGNSSRCGKYAMLHFAAQEEFAICGCSVEDYLLERSHVVAQPAMERNYHIFTNSCGRMQGRSTLLRVVRRLTTTPRTGPTSLGSTMLLISRSWSP